MPQHPNARLTPPDVEACVLEARRSMKLARVALAAATGAPTHACARIVAHAGLPRLADADCVTGGQPPRPGDTGALREGAPQ